MSTYSPNLFAVLSEGGEVRPEPVAAPKEEKKVEQPKAENKRTPKGGGKIFFFYVCHVLP